MHIVYPITFGDLYYESYYHYGGLLKDILLTLCAVLYFSLLTHRAKSTVLLMLLYNLFTKTTDATLGDVSSVYYMIESLFFTSWCVWIMTRPEITTPKTINKDNILLAFYRGEKGSFTMHFFDLVGLPVKSMCIIAGEKCLRLKASRETFQLTNSGNYFSKDRDYYVVDTGVKYNDRFIAKMNECVNMKATKGFFRIRCIEAVSDLLAMIGEQYRPRGLLERIPSRYLYKVLVL